MLLRDRLAPDSHLSQACAVSVFTVFMLAPSLKAFFVEYGLTGGLITIVGASYFQAFAWSRRSLTRRNSQSRHGSYAWPDSHHVHSSVSVILLAPGEYDG